MSIYSVVFQYLLWMRYLGVLSEGQNPYCILLAFWLTDLYRQLQIPALLHFWMYQDRKLITSCLISVRWTVLKYVLNINRVIRVIAIIHFLTIELNIKMFQQ